MTTLDDRTKVGLYAVLGIVPIFCGAVFWISMIYFKVEAAEKINVVQDQKMDTQMEVLMQIRDDVREMKVKLKYAK